jgi:membrane-associated phospholipid phosphatase
VLRSLDLALLRLLRTRGHAAPAERAVTLLSRLGEHGAAWCALAAAGALLGRRDRAVYRRALRVTVAAYAANQVMKLVVRRRRPRLEGLSPLADTISELSYPSAHATTSFAAARALCPVLPAPGLYGVAAGMALSRPYLGVHYPSDTVAGALLGNAVARLLP